ncbi:ABC transporter substrate-binding protein [Rhodococcus sp. ARC_M6]|uniref:ABC transporter substrate-binding protein n=1 Tax=Rhodococcus sp. ARC_M6 TaxID=2928852 RepID=UPI001FB3E1D3|nr:ABC transporter substrate-binding protein [Rhodococcus sp. ARC_M6]MCJ0903742.1 ABC transporter substrate-binding protein [Rhodococcus sp. ARC_M6]
MRAAKKTLGDAGWKPGSDGVLTKGGHALHLTVIFANVLDSTSAAAEYAMKQWQELGAKVELRGGDNNFNISNTFAAKDLTSWSISIGLTVQSDKASAASTKSEPPMRANTPLSRMTIAAPLTNRASM